MCVGLGLSIVANRALGSFHYRAQYSEVNHQILSEGIYSQIRHPIYLGNILLFVFAGVSVSNFLVLIVIAVVTIPAYLRTISIEEGILMKMAGKQYVEYSHHTRRLVPFLF
jgi:protein-S-isoprenylcysteine O-methyltransferase Ste14